MSKSVSRWVIKVGSHLVCTGGPILLRAWMQQVLQLRKRGVEVIWVTSGAIATAVERTGFEATERSLAEKQALSAIGQPSLMDLYNLSLNSVSLKGAQILLTSGDMQDNTRRTNLENTLNKLLEWGVVPILNENDAVATEEIKFGDNDSLSAKVAIMMGAHKLVILTDVDGLHDKDPSKHTDSKIVHEVREIDQKLLDSVATEAGSKSGTGGMFSKLSAAKEALSAGISSHLLKGDQPNILVRAFEGESLGTKIGGLK